MAWTKQLIVGALCVNILSAGSLMTSAPPAPASVAMLDDDGVTELGVVVPLGMAVEVRVDWLTGEVVGRAIGALPVAEDHAGAPGGCIVMAPFTSGPAQSPVTFAPLCAASTHTTPITTSVLACSAGSQCVSIANSGAAFLYIVCQPGGLAVVPWAGGGPTVMGCAIFASAPFPNTWTSWQGTIFRSGAVGWAVGFHNH